MLKRTGISLMPCLFCLALFANCPRRDQPDSPNHLPTSGVVDLSIGSGKSPLIRKMTLPLTEQRSAYPLKCEPISESCLFEDGVVSDDTYIFSIVIDLQSASRIAFHSSPRSQPIMRSFHSQAKQLDHQPMTFFRWRALLFSPNIFFNQIHPEIRDTKGERSLENGVDAIVITDLSS